MPMEPYLHQKRVAELLLIEKRNVILQAPTGAGKTHAAMLPFLQAIDHGLDFPRKCIYSVPMRVLANQFVALYRSAIRHAARDDRIRVAIQTGEHQESPEFSANLIFATIDQTLSSFLLSPYSLPRRQANINAGAILSSYLVFDEFHLYAPDSTLPTTLEMLKMLKGITPFILMTATFSGDMLHELAETLDAAIVPGTPAERDALLALGSQQKTRRYHVVDTPLSATAILTQHHAQRASKRSLVICNTIDRARALYERIKAQKDSSDEVLLLHSRFLPDDRREKERIIRERFSKDDHTDGSVIVVSTQAIEVGLDITSVVLHTELAPANAIIQRAGRCARYEGEIGDVYIYPLSHDTDGTVIDLTETAHINPYRGQRDVLIATLEQFRQCSGEAFTFLDEQAVLSAAHGEQDRSTINQLNAGSWEHRREMFAAMRGETGAASALVRRVIQQRVTIHAAPDQLLDRPLDAPSFGLHPGMIQKYLRGTKDPDTGEYTGGWLERDDLDWAVMWLHEYDDPDQSNRSEYTWERVDTPETARGARLLVVHPSLATYSPELGFLPDRGGTWLAELPEKEEARRSPTYTYYLETYEDHIRRVYEAYRKFWPEVAWAARRTEQHFSLEAGSIQRAAELAVLLHDVGKLSKGWQGWVRKYQEAIGEPVAPGQAYAHTHSETEAHKEAAKRAGRRPTHAVEGAIASAVMLAEVLEEDILLRAAFSAIARHHAADSSQNQKFRLKKDALEHIRATLALWRHGALSIPSEIPGYGETIPSHYLDIADSTDLLAVPDDAPGEEDYAAFFTYLLVVRILRRADQQGTAWGTLGL